MRHGHQHLADWRESEIAGWKRSDLRAEPAAAAPRVVTHSYRATLVPPNMAAEDVQPAADAGMLPTIQVRATDNGSARRAAQAVTAWRVLDVVRIEQTSR